MEGVETSEGGAIPLPNVTGKILAKVIEYCKHHLDHPTPVTDDKKEEKRTDDIIPWDQDFCNVDQQTLFELILVVFLVLFFFLLTPNRPPTIWISNPCWI
jgi:S-phase kinase-associated protein 1